MARVLIVDDDVVVRRLIASLLEIMQHDVAEAQSGADAINAHQENPFDLVITDIYMPDMDGLELIQLFGGSAKKPLIIAMSGGGIRTRMDPLPAAERFGAAAVIYKPIDLSTLEALIMHLLNRAL